VLKTFFSDFSSPAVNSQGEQQQQQKKKITKILTKGQIEGRKDEDQKLNFFLLFPRRIFNFNVKVFISHFEKKSGFPWN
jgi:hypothetical protein